MWTGGQLVQFTVRTGPIVPCGIANDASFSFFLEWTYHCLSQKQSSRVSGPRLIFEIPAMYRLHQLVSYTVHFAQDCNTFLTYFHQSAPSLQRKEVHSHDSSRP